MKLIASHEFGAPEVHHNGDAWNADCADNIAAEGIGFSIIRFEQFSVAFLKVGRLSHSAEHIYTCGTQLGKTMAVTLPMYGRLRW